MKKTVGSLIIAVALGFSGNSMALTVTQTSNANTLATNILGSGIAIVGTPTYTGAAVASGTFTGGVASGIGIESGVILTSGNVNLAPGPNNSDAAGLNVGLGGDANLATLIPGYTTYDASKLEFDFTTAGGDLYFNYVFASDEYNEWANTSFNDVFGFFLDGTNIALIPGTSTPVSINNVNLVDNPGFYNNNDPTSFPGGTPFNIQYDGFTDVFTATALGVGTGTHHIKLAIADAGDHILDSAVFIQAGSFSDTSSTSVPEPSTALLLGSGLIGLGYVARRKRA